MVSLGGARGEQGYAGLRKHGTMVSTCVDIAGVTGSIPVAPTISFNGLGLSNAVPLWFS
jgi:hypothetical protein